MQHFTFLDKHTHHACIMCNCALTQHSLQCSKKLPPLSNLIRESPCAQHVAAHELQSYRTVNVLTAAVSNHYDHRTDTQQLRKHVAFSTASRLLHTPL